LIYQSGLLASRAVPFPQPNNFPTRQAFGQPKWSGMANTSVAFREVPGDPLDTKIYQLRNGLTLYLSVNRREPRIFTNIVVRAGSKQDPADTTGLAHYMEHMLFKGTSRIGALDWEKESAYLEQIAERYEQHRAATSDAERRRIYAEIDRLSNEAAQYVAPNEYDRLLGAIGAKETNAYTSVDQTVFLNDIPANELPRWMELEAERFRMMALRLFHTELETVYEEFNIGQDQDARKVNRLIREALFPNHPYGTQTTIGSAEHLRRPSQRKIQEYFHTYYVPNNMAIILAGDFDPEQAVALAEQHFGSFEAKPLPPFTYGTQPPLHEPQRREAYGQEAPFVDIAWRFQGAATDDPMMLSLLQHLLHNHQAGLLDLHLNHQQRVLEANAWAWQYQDYSVLGVVARPREGQSMEAAEKLLMGEVQRLREGAFDDWMLEAAIRDLRRREVKATEHNRGRADLLAMAFVLGLDLQRLVGRFDWWGRVRKADVADFARNRMGDGRVVIYKHRGEDPAVLKVEKPPITHVHLQRDKSSAFAKAFLEREAAPLQPDFTDFESAIQTAELQPGLKLDYVHNRENELFRLDCVFEMGKLHDPKLPLAVLYLPYLGTPRYSAAELQRQFFRLGLSFDVHADNHCTYLSLSGLNESLPEGLRLMEHLLAEMQPDDTALLNLINNTLKRRQNAKQNRGVVLRYGLGSYARYGPRSPFAYRLSEEELHALRAEELVELLKGLRDFQHKWHYYGPFLAREVAHLLEQRHRRPSHLRPIPVRRPFEQLATEENEVLFLDYPIVQADVLMVSRGTPFFSLLEFEMSEWYNEYFGFGLSSLVFQEIRESRALAYSTFAYYSSPDRLKEAHYLQAYLGTQPDKLSEALPALSGIIHDMPLVEPQAEQARHSILRRLASERIEPSQLYWEARAASRLGYSKDMRQGIYEHLSRAKPPELQRFQEDYVRGRAFRYMVLGSRERIDWAALEKIGPVRELRMEELFGY
jgi:predicted Zn-dependent peptidase